MKTKLLYNITGANLFFGCSVTLDVFIYSEEYDVHSQMKNRNYWQTAVEREI